MGTPGSSPATERGVSCSEEHPVSLVGDARPFFTCKEKTRAYAGRSTAVWALQWETPWGCRVLTAGQGWTQEDLLHRDRR